MNTYIIYQITVNNHVYIGATTNYISRCRTHNAGLKRIILVGKIERRTWQWKMFEPTDLIKYGYTIDIYSKVDSAIAARDMEQSLIDKYNSLGLSLNVCLKSGLPC